jgi:tRNA (cytosine40_48-C5)-methyltransferase
MEKNLKKRHELIGHKIIKIKLPTAIRINTLRIEENKIIERLEKKGVKLKKIPFLKNGYYTESAFSLGSTTEYLLGYFYIQEAASQKAVEILNPKKNQTILDCCAAPGGKTTQIAQIMENTGTIFAFDNKSNRLLSLKSNLERCGIKNTNVFLKDIIHTNNEFGNFDKILVDAPCSGNHIVDKEWFEKKTLDDIKKNEYIQENIMNSVIKTFAGKNTEIIYSTCSLEPEENEFLIQKLIDKFKIKLEKVEAGSPAMTEIFGKKLNKEISKCARFWPNIHNTQAFFIAKFKIK